MIVEMFADGSARWWSEPEGWRVSMGLGGVIFSRATANGTLELARLASDFQSE